MVLWDYFKGDDQVEDGRSSDETEDPFECRHHTALVEECSRGFELAEQMEAGRAREAPFGVLSPLRRGTRLRKFYVVRSANQLEFSLYRDDTNAFMMHAKVIPAEGRADLSLYHPKDPSYDASRPCVSLFHSSDKKNWVAYAEKCQHCHYMLGREGCRAQGGQEILRVSHDQIRIGEGLFNTMDIAVPSVGADGAQANWCPKVGTPPPGEVVADIHAADECSEVLLLASKRPAWHKEMRSLVLDFKDRSVIPSAKNFQLVAAQRKSGHISCQYGKVGSDKYCLDLRGPLSVAQGFSLALTTMFWK